MKLIETEVKDCYIVALDCHVDKRGFFTEIFNMKNGLFKTPPLQINWSYSEKNVIRGLHITPFAKLVTCVKGVILDVCVDMRPESETYLKYATCLLTHVHCNQLYIPPNCAHGFAALDEENVVVYSQDGTYDPKVERSIVFDDPKIGIQWPKNVDFIISEKDLNAERLT